MILLEFTVRGPPVSHQTHNRGRLERWKQAVAAAAAEYWSSQAAPSASALRMTVVYYHEGESAIIDNDNLVKPVQDALIGLVYVDDRHVIDVSVHKRSIDARYQVRRMSAILAAAFVAGDEFLHVRIEDAEDTGRLP